MIFSSPSDVHYKGDFYPFDTSLSNVLQWKKFWCDPLKNIDVYDSSELFFYTILLPFLVWGIVKIWPAVFRSIRNFCQKIRKVVLSTGNKPLQSKKAFATVNFAKNTTNERRKRPTNNNLLIKAIIAFVCFILLGVKMCSGYNQDKKDNEVAVDEDSIEAIVDSVIDVEESISVNILGKEHDSTEDKDSIVEVVDDDLELFNSDRAIVLLTTGDTPYSAYYGNNMNCRKIECSGIKVTAPETSDVVVIIKKRNEHGKVAGHAYISAGDTYKIDLPDGTYQTFFYYGDEWSSYKDMGNGIKGGFVRDELFAKDNPQEIYGAVLSYVLQLRRDGNFHTKSSSRSEMF